MTRQPLHPLIHLQPVLVPPKLKRLSSLCSALVLSGVLSVGAGLVLLPEAAVADSSLTPSATKNQITNALGDKKQRLAEKPSTTLPSSLANRLRQDLSQRIRIPVGKLRVVEATPKTWSNGCLGLAAPNEFCTEALVEGWRVVLSDGSKRWVYRTDRQGRTYRLETSDKPTSAQPNTVNSTIIPMSELPPQLENRAVFRSISSGGFMGRTYQTTLLKDGRVVRVLVSPNGTTMAPQVHRVSQQQVQRFIQLLEQNSMSRYDRMHYPAKSGSADFITVTLSSRSTTLRYADSVQNQLPDSLQTIIQAWSEITRNS